MLDDDVRTAWISLERNMHVILRAMLHACPGSVPEFFQFWAFPRMFGYEWKYKSLKRTAKAALQSQDAFVPLMAATSLLLLLLGQRESEVEGFNWHQ